MIFRNDPRRIAPVFFVSCLLPLTAAFANGRLENVRPVEFLLIFVSGVGLGASAATFFAIKRGQKGS